MKRLLIAFLLLVSVVPVCFAGGNKELRKSESKILTDNIIKWKGHEIRNYTMKVQYSYSNNLGNVYELKVRDGVLEKGSADYERLAALTVEKLFEDARKYVKQNKQDAPMLYMIRYDEKYGFINSLARIYNPKVKAGVAPAGYNFIIKVLDFRIDEKKKEL